MHSKLLQIASISIVAAACIGNASAQTVQISNNGTLIAATSSVATNNDLTLNNGMSQYNFSGATGSFSTLTATDVGSPTGMYYYADYLISINTATAESVTTSLQNLNGVGGLTERIYTYNPAAGTNGFLGDMSLSAAGVVGEQAWSTDIPLQGVDVSIISPTNLTSGSYVVELRGNNVGSFGGTLSITSAVPEPQVYLMLLSGLSLLLLLVVSRNVNGTTRLKLPKLSFDLTQSVEAFLFREKSIIVSGGMLG